MKKKTEPQNIPAFMVATMKAGVSPLPKALVLAFAENHDCVEPISKSFEEDDEAGELREAEEVLRVELPTDKNAALPLNPGEEPLDQPAPGISPKSSSILRGAPAAIGSMRRDSATHALCPFSR